MNTKEASLDNTIEVGYTSSRKDVYTEMTSKGGDYSDARIKVAYESKLKHSKSLEVTLS